VPNPSLADIITKYQNQPEVRAGIDIEAANRLLGRYLRELRVAQQFPLDSLANKLSLTTKELARMESGRGIDAISVMTLSQWACVLGAQASLSIIPSSPASAASRGFSGLRVDF